MKFYVSLFSDRKSRSNTSIQNSISNKNLIYIFYNDTEVEILNFNNMKTETKHWNFVSKTTGNYNFDEIPDLTDE